MIIANSTEKGTCGSCGHKEVCIYKERLEKAQDEINNVMLHEDNRSIYIRDVDFINPIMITCKYWLPEERVTFR